MAPRGVADLSGAAVRSLLHKTVGAVVLAACLACTGCSRADEAQNGRRWHGTQEIAQMSTFTKPSDEELRTRLAQEGTRSP